MAQKDRKSAYEDELAEAKWMVEGVSDGGFKLEEIMAEYGRGAAGVADVQEEPAAQPVPEDETPEPEKTPPEPKKPPAKRKKAKIGKKTLRLEITILFLMRLVNIAGWFSRIAL